MSEKKWDKMKSQIAELEDLLTNCPEEMPLKTLEKIRGFLNYVTQTYRGMIPYLNGLHLTIDSWRPNRNAAGWKVKRPDPVAPEAYPARPKHVKAVPRLSHDVNALKELCSSRLPPWRRVRPKRTATVFYGFGDASGSAFGAALQRASTIDANEEDE